MISIVIPAFNEEKVIAGCLESLVKQITHTKIEVIVVDNGSTDKTKQIAQKFLRKLDLKIITEKTRGRGAARAAGFKAAQGDIITSTDADALLPPTWIEDMLNELKSTNNIAVCGPCKFYGLSRTKIRFLNWFQPLAMNFYRLFIGHYWLSGFNFSIKKDAYVAAGGFDRRLNTNEDLELSFRVKKLGRIRYAPKICVVISARRLNQGIIKGLFSYIKVYIDYFFLKKDNVRSDDVR